MPDAVVIGAGPNGLISANLLADAGWSVEVLETQDEPGGAVRHDRGVDPDFASDLFSAFYPLAAASPVLAALNLEREGLGWSHAPKVLAHPLQDGHCAVLSRDPEETAASLETFAPGDGAAWKELREVWETLRPDILDALFTPFPRSAPEPGWRGGCAPPAGYGWPGRWCCRCGGWARRNSAARAAGSCSRAVPCTRTSRRRQRAAAASAGSCPCSARPTGFPFPPEAPGRSPPLSSAAWRAAAAPSTAGNRSPRSSSTAGGPSASAPRAARQFRPAGQCWPTCPRRRCTALWWPNGTSPGGCSPT